MRANTVANLSFKSERNLSQSESSKTLAGSLARIARHSQQHQAQGLPVDTDTVASIRQITRKTSARSPTSSTSPSSSSSPASLLDKAESVDSLSRSRRSSLSKRSVNPKFRENSAVGDNITSAPSSPKLPTSDNPDERTTLPQRISSLLAEKTHMENQLKILLEKLNEKETQLQSKDTACETCKNTSLQLELLKTEYESLKEAHQQTVRENEVLKQILSSQNKRKSDDDTSENNENGESEQLLLKEYNNLQQSYNKLREEFVESVKTHKEQEMCLNSEISQLGSELDKVNEEHEELKSDYLQLVAEQEQLALSHNVLQIEYDQISEKYNELNADMNELTDLLKGLPGYSDVPSSSVSASFIASTTTSTTTTSTTTVNPQTNGIHTNGVGNHPEITINENDTNDSNSSKNMTENNNEPKLLINGVKQRSLPEAQHKMKEKSRQQNSSKLKKKKVARKSLIRANIYGLDNTIIHNPSDEQSYEEWVPVFRDLDSYLAKLGKKQLSEFQKSKLFNSVLQIDQCEDISDKGTNKVQVSVISPKSHKTLKITLTHLDYEDLFFFQQITRARTERQLREELSALKFENSEFKEKILQLVQERDQLSVKIQAVEYKLQVLEDLDTERIDLSRDFDARLNGLTKEYQSHLGEVINQLKEVLSEKAQKTSGKSKSELESHEIVVEEKKVTTRHIDAEVVKLRRKLQDLTEENELFVKCNQSLLKIIAESRVVHQVKPRILLHARNKVEVLETLAQVAEDTDTPLS